MFPYGVILLTFEEPLPYVILFKKGNIRPIGDNPFLNPKIESPFDCDQLSVDGRIAGFFAAALQGVIVYVRFGDAGCLQFSEEGDRWSLWRSSISTAEQ